MNIALTPETQRLLEERMRRGGYMAPDDAIRAGLYSLEQQERLADFDSGELEALLAEGERSIREEGSLDGDEAFDARRQRRQSPQAKSE